MGKKKAATRGDDNQQPAAGGKSKKKALVIDDDEYAIGSELSEEQPKVEEDNNVGVMGKKKGKKGNQKGSKGVDDDNDDNEEKDNDDLAEEPLELAFSGKKKKSKGKKGGGETVFPKSGFGLLGDDDDDNGNEDDEESEVTNGKGDVDDENEPEVVFSGKKKGSKKSGKGGGSGFLSLSNFDAIGDGDDNDDEDDVEADNDEPVIEFTGEKKSSKGDKKKGSNTSFKAVSFDVLDENGEEQTNEDEDLSAITFSGKKKKSSKSSTKNANKFSAALMDEENDEDTPASESFKATDDPGDIEDDGSKITFTGKKKSSKKKGANSSAFSTLDDEDGSAINDTVEPEQPSNAETTDTSSVSKSEEVPETSKNKKKKKKSGRTAQEEDDLDKILAELGEGPIAKPSDEPSQAEKVQEQPEPSPAVAEAEKEGEEEKGESAAAKKKKKKKEKEKEKKAAAAAAAAEKAEEAKAETDIPKRTDAKARTGDKKIPKHVREMQEALARRKELEEKKAREEEEKRRKEEEERLRQEELLRQQEEIKRRRKEREKEKLLQKKKEGKLLTAKQKEEQRRLEAMRNQLLANASIDIPTADKDSAPAKRPVYKSKKSKPAHQHANGAPQVKVEEIVEVKSKEQDQLPEVEPVELKKDEAESVNVETAEVSKGEENEIQEEDDEDDEWDAKSLDDFKIKGASEDEEVEPEPKVVKKDVKSSVPASQKAAPAEAVAEIPVPSQPPISQDNENKKQQPKVEVADKTRKNNVKNEASLSDASHKQGEENLRSPICCIMGHVDTGKTKLLDCIRGTNVQEGEAGGITQQIGATYFPAENIRQRTRELKADAKLKVPGLLVIDTPGHESFTNLRSRGSGLCDIAILVVDIMHGLEPQTIESLNLLKMRNTEFIVALNKVDRLYGWKVCRNAPIVKAMKQQSKDVINEFNHRLIQIVTQFKEQGINTELYYKNKEMGETFSIVPTSAISGEGIPDLLLLLVQWTQKTMVEKLTFSDEVQCTVLEVKVIEGHGTTIDVVLVNGVLHEGDQIVVCGLQGPIVTTIRALLTPHPMRELRVKGAYLHHKEIKAAQGIKISAQGLEHAIAGTGLYVIGPEDDVEDVKQAAMEDMKSVMSRIDKSGEGVYVQASTLGSLEALLEFLKSPAVKIPVSGIGIGPVHKKDVMKASVMLEKNKEYAVILAFDVKVTPEAKEIADELGVKIFLADIIYHLFDQFKAYMDNLKEEKKKEAADEAVFPCVLKILPNCVFNKKDPIVLGVDVLEGIAKVGTLICIPQREFIDIGRIASIENNHKPVDYAKKGQKVAIKIIGSNPDEQQKMFGRHFEIEDELVSHITRKSIDILKANYRDDLSIDEWKLVVKLKNLFKIQ